MELGTSTLTRRERIERIATAERDRRAGRAGLAIAALGEATEWPARVVLALARMPEAAADETRRILEEGLDLWAREAGLDPLDGAPTDAPTTGPNDVDGSAAASEPEPAFTSGSEAPLDRPIDPGELERAFAEAEAQIDEMQDANDVAERVLMSEPVDLAELDGEEAIAGSQPARALAMDAASVEDAPDEEAGAGREDHGEAGSEALATLERWLENLEGRHAGRAQ